MVFSLHSYQTREEHWLVPWLPITTGTATEESPPTQHHGLSPMTCSVYPDWRLQTSHLHNQQAVLLCYSKNLWSIMLLIGLMELNFDSIALSVLSL